MDISSGVLLTVTALAALWDLTLRRVPNALVLTGLLLGFSFFPEFSYFGKCLFPVVILYLPWGLGLIGAGDLKLLAIVCGYLPVEEWFDFFLIFILSAAGMSVLWLILGSDLWIQISDRFCLLFSMKKRKRIWGASGQRPGRVELPLSAAVLIGVCGVLLPGVL